MWRSLRALHTTSRAKSRIAARWGRKALFSRGRRKAASFSLTNCNSTIFCAIACSRARKRRASPHGNLSCGAPPRPLFFIRPLCSPPLRHRNLTSQAPNSPCKLKEGVMSILLSDFVALTFGLVLLGLMALYAKALTRV